VPLVLNLLENILYKNLLNNIQLYSIFAIKERIMQVNIKEKIIECINETINEKVKYFYIEKEFQFFLARKLQEKLPEADITIEFNELNFKTDDYIKNLPDKDCSYCSFDISIRLNNKYYPIEIKYSGYEGDSPKESFGSSIESILSDKNKNNFIIDINKIESIIGKSDKGYCIFLTTGQKWIENKINKKISEQKPKYSINDNEIRYYNAESKSGEKYRYLIIEIM
jgi:hypothetical protein